jgi:putative ABC transport system permease protein
MILAILGMPLAMARLMYQSMALALVQIWANKMRSILTTLGIIIGVASVTAVIAAMTGLRTKVMTDLESFGSNNIYVIPQRPDTGPMKYASWSMLRFKPEDMDDMVTHCPDVETFTRLTTVGNEASYGQNTASPQVMAIDVAWHSIQSRGVVEGRPFLTTDESSARQVCLITPKLKAKLKLDRDCTGQAIFIQGRSFRIVGVVEDMTQSSMFSGESPSDGEAFLPFITCDRLWKPFFYVIVKARSPEVADEARAEMGFYLRKIRHIKPGEPDTFRMEVVEQVLEKVRSITMVMTAVAGGIVGISLLVGGVGIMNIMLVSVSERTREIGLRKAVGARPGAIMLQFLVEAVMLCLIGGLIGIGVGQVLTMMVTKIPGAQLEQAHIPFYAVMLAFGFSAGVGVCFGFFPAVKAARLDPIEALRHE